MRSTLRRFTIAAFAGIAAFATITVAPAGAHFGGPVGCYNCYGYYGGSYYVPHRFAYAPYRHRYWGGYRHFGHYSYHRWR